MILYLEVPSFYAALERVRQPRLRERPVIVGGDPRKRGLVQSASAEARAVGVKPGMGIQQAIALCPDAQIVKTDMKYYREVSGRLRGCLRSEFGSLEALALDSAYLDTSRFSETPEELGQRAVLRVRALLDLPLRVGIASVKFLARLAAEEAGEGGVFRIPSGRQQSFLDALPLDRLPGVGPKTRARLRALGAQTGGDLRTLDRHALESSLGNHGLKILAYAQGHEDATVRAQGHPRSFSREHTFSMPQLDVGELWECLQRLSQLLGESLQEQALVARRVAMKVRFDDQQVTTRSRTLQSPIAGAAEIHSTAVTLLESISAGTRGVSLIGVSVAGLGPRPEDTQLELFPQ